MNEEKRNDCLFSLWNCTISRSQAQEELRQILARRTPRRLFRDLRRTKERGRKTVPTETFLTACALFFRGRNSEDEILSALRETQMERMLLIGFRIFLLNETKKNHFTIAWTDRSFSSTYKWLSRFAGMFHDMEYREWASVVRLLHRLYPDEIWQLAKEDPHDWILLNWFDTFGDTPPLEKALQLLVPEQSPRRQALAFWWLAFPLSRLKHSDEQAHAVLSALTKVPAAILVPQIYGFLLTEHCAPQPFRAYLLDPSHVMLLRSELERKKLCDFREAAAVALLIREMKPGRKQKTFWKILLSIIEEKIKNGDFDYCAQKSQAFLCLLPEWGLAQLKEHLHSWSETKLHTQIIDFIVRPQLHQHDSTIQATIQAIALHCTQ